MDSVVAELLEKVDSLQSTLKDQDYLDLCKMLQKLHNTTAPNPQKPMLGESNPSCHTHTPHTTHTTHTSLVPVVDIYLGNIMIPVHDNDNGVYFECPKCKVMCERVGGCQHVMCQCGHLFTDHSTDRITDRITNRRQTFYDTHPEIQCQGTTKKGKRCMNNGPVNGYCYLHRV